MVSRQALRGNNVKTKITGMEQWPQILDISPIRVGHSKQGPGGETGRECILSP